MGVLLQGYMLQAERLVACQDGVMVMLQAALLVMLRFRDVGPGAVLPWRVRHESG